MGRSSHRPPKSKKLTKSRPPALPEVSALINHAETLDSVKKIVTGRISRGRSGPPACHFVADSQIRLTVNGHNQKQELFIYTNDPKDVGSVLTELRDYWQRKIAA